ncbi:MAG: DNA polymerase III subunit chi [Syntrophobacterales bacterium]|nr:DNA polymerase III subunit chi [Syntrophobacterales bacterium]
MVIFIETPYSSRERDVCDILEFLSDRFDCRVQLISSSTVEASHIDGMLWTFKKESFVPHAILGPGESVEDRLEKVLITIDSPALKGCNVRVPLNVDFDVEIFKNCDLGIVFVFSDDEHQKSKVRNIWRELTKLSIPKKHVVAVDKHLWMSLIYDALSNR